MQRTARLLVPVRPITPKLKVVDGLQASNFTVTEDRIPHKICGLTHGRQPVSTGILLDTSASMRGVARAATEAVDQLLSTSGPQDEYFLEDVNTTPTVQCLFSCDPARIRAALQPHSSGRTALIDAMFVAHDAMRKARHPNRALLIISDAEDNCSTRLPGEFARALAAFPVPIFLVIPVDRRALEPVFTRKDLVRLAKWSGGYAVQVNRSEMLPAVTDIVDVIRRPYLISLRGPSTRGNTQFGELRVEVNGVRTRPALLFREVIRYAN